MATSKLPKVLDSSEDSEAARRMFYVFREINGDGREDLKKSTFFDRHNYFKNFDPLVKEAAFKVIHSDDYESYQQKAMSLLSALNIKPTITTLNSMSKEPLMCFELNCEIDVVLVAQESKIYHDVIHYFTTMLA
ncbi:uncharacterized protein LOC6731402 [Drosophila simulans]|uniref:GD22464 n=1 Tax=Drosophila simulans TaxID=7240 RepID=B4Q5U4_DROSI|nr:uncharacterized protein LOC6731402 [Drosophila simulans]EDX04140.1 GD22464 [Drosophila simulans]